MFPKKFIKEIFSKKGIFLIIFIGIIEQICFVLLPYLFGKIVDIITNFQVGESLNYFWFLVIVGAISSSLNIFLGTYKYYLSDFFCKNFYLYKLKEYSTRFLNLDFEVRNISGTGKNLTILNRGSQANQNLAKLSIELFSRVIPRTLMILLIFIFNFPTMILFIIAIIIISIFLNSFLDKKVKKLTDKEQELYENSSRQYSKIIMESNLINISNNSEKELGILDERLKELPQTNKNIYILNDLIFNGMRGLFLISEYIIYLILGFLAFEGKISIGEVVMLISYLSMIQWPLNNFLQKINQIREDKSKYEKAENLVNTPNKIINGKNIFKFSKGNIELKNVSFKYSEDSKEIFNNFSLSFKGGEKTALVGHSGSGKSTIIKLILRNYLPNSGKILIDNQDLKDLEISSFYQNIGYLSQEPAIFDGTISENLIYGILENNSCHFEKNDSKFVGEGLKPSLTEKVQISENDLWNALEKVGLKQRILESKDGLETEVGEKGIQLSGGERQRLAMARIIIGNPNILILDEPTSALDSISEDLVSKVLEDLMKNKTVIIIAHRLQTVIDADKIIVLENGKVVESGNHKELLQNNGLYKSLVNLQTGKFNE